MGTLYDRILAAKRISCQAKINSVISRRWMEIEEEKIRRGRAHREIELFQAGITDSLNLPIFD